MAIAILTKLERRAEQLQEQADEFRREIFKLRNAVRALREVEDEVKSRPPRRPAATQDQH